MQSGSRRLVAVVDDDDAVRDSLRFLLEIVGHSVVTYSSAAQFLLEAPVDQPRAWWSTSTCPTRQDCNWCPVCAAGA